MALLDYKTDIYNCIKCGACRIGYGSFLPICPSGEKFGFNSYYAQGRLDLAKGLLEKKIDWSENLLQRIYSCTDCDACYEMCYPQTGIRTTAVIREMKSEAVERGIIPRGIKNFLVSVDRFGNPFNESAETRMKWADGLDVKIYSNEEYLLYVGCEASYDDRGREIARALCSFLIDSGVSFGVLGTEEINDGNDVLAVGDKWLFESLATRNIEKFRSRGVKKIITLSPHSYNIFRNEYPKFGGDFEVLHYTQLARELARGGKSGGRKGSPVRVAYHDSCYLGRRNGEYDAPRETLRAIPDVELMELDRNRSNSFCCGGGGGNYYSDALGVGVNSPARIRVREARSAGAEVLAVACPMCARMLSDAVKTEGLEGELEVKDIAELVVGE